MADAPPTVAEKTNLYEYLVALTYFLRDCATISLVEHIHEVVGEGIWIDVAMVYALFHNISLPLDCADRVC
jgi:hypothetical protein